MVLDASKLLDPFKPLHAAMPDEAQLEVLDFPSSIAHASIA